MDGTLPFDCHPQLQLDRTPKKSPLRDPRVDLRLSELSFASSAFTITPFPTHLLRHRHSPTGRVKLEQSTTNRCEIDGQDQTAKFLGLTNNSTVEGGGNLDDHNYPFRTQSYQAAAILRMIASVLMVQEEKKADEFGPEPKPEEVEDAREVSLMKTIDVTEEYRGGLPRWY